MRSMRTCICWNAGTIRETIRPSTSTVPGIANTSTTESPRSSRTAITMPITIVSGAAIIIVAAMTTSICTCWTSFVIRVISDAAPNRPTSRAE